MNPVDLSLRAITSVIGDDDKPCEMTCMTGRPSRTKGAVLYIGDAHGRCHFYSHSKQTFYQDPILLFPNSKNVNKRIS